MLTYYLIQYIPENGAEQTIGLVAHDGQNGHFRALGVRNRDEVDTSPFLQRTGIESENAWAYAEWVDYFFDIVENETLAGFEKEIERIAATGTAITVSQRFTAKIAAGQNPAAMVDQFYARASGT